MYKKFNRVTFEELHSSLSHYEVVFLSYCKALEILRSGRSLMTNDRYKPKVAMVALEELCSDLEGTLKFKEELRSKIFTKESTSSEEEDVEYEIPGLSSDESE